jgi:hypothetical protein
MHCKLHLWGYFTVLLAYTPVWHFCPQPIPSHYSVLMAKTIIYGCWHLRVTATWLMFLCFSPSAVTVNCWFSLRVRSDSDKQECASVGSLQSFSSKSPYWVSSWHWPVQICFHGPLDMTSGVHVTQHDHCAWDPAVSTTSLSKELQLGALHKETIHVEGFLRFALPPGSIEGTFYVLIILTWLCQHRQDSWSLNYTDLNNLELSFTEHFNNIWKSLGKNT